MASLDSSPTSYPTDGLAIHFYQLEPDASVSGIVFDQESQEPISGVEVNFGALSVLTDDNGFYEIAEIMSGVYEVSITKDGYLDFNLDGFEIFEGENSLDAELVFSGFPCQILSSSRTLHSSAKSYRSWAEKKVLVACQTKLLKWLQSHSSTFKTNIELSG